MLPVYVNIFVCGPLHHYVLLFSIFGAVGLFRSDMLLIFELFFCKKIPLSRRVGYVMDRSMG